MPTGPKPSNIPTQRCGTVGSPVVYDGEEVTLPNRAKYFAEDKAGLVACLNAHYRPYAETEN